MNNYTTGNYAEKWRYMSYKPATITRQWDVNDMEVLRMLEEASRQLGRLDMYIEQNKGERFLNLFVAQEAVFSMRLSGLSISLADYIDQKDNWAKYPAAKEIYNFINAAGNGIEKLKKLPFSARLIRDIHRHLQLGGMGHDKLPGDYRTSQTWVGGASMQDASYIPPTSSSIVEMMSDWELFANSESQNIPALLKAAILHYQFEAIHPFLDGNGRLGRMLINLYLVHSGLLKYPMLVVSKFFDEHKMHYIDNQMRVRTHDDMNQWLKFFLTAVIESTRFTLKNLQDLVEQTNLLATKINTLGIRSNDAMKVLNYINEHWLLSVVEVEELINKSNVTAYKLLDDLVEMGVLVETSGLMRNRVYTSTAMLGKFK